MQSMAADRQVEAQIEQTGNARAPSLVRMLLWKEWRQQRLIAALIVGIPLLVMLLGLSPVAYSLAGEAAKVSVVLAAFFAAAMGPVVLGANAFCGEEDDGTTAFLKSLPSGWSIQFWVKALTVGIFSTAVMFVVVLAVRLGPDVPSGYDRVVAVLPTALAAAWAAALAPAAVSLVARQTLACAILSAILITGLAGWFFMLANTALMRNAALTLTPRFTWQALVLVTAILFTVAGWWFWVVGRGPRGWASRLLHGGGLLAVIITVTASPIICAHLYFAFLATPAEFLRLNTGLGKVSADGRMISVSAWSQTWLAGARPAMIDIQTGKWRWVRTSRMAFPMYWSPSGRRLLVAVCDIWRRPFVSDARFERAEVQYAVADSEGKLTPLHSYCPAIPKWCDKKEGPFACGWMDDDTCVLMNERRAMFVDLRNGKTSICALSQDDGNAISVSQWTEHIAGDTVYAECVMNGTQQWPPQRYVGCFRRGVTSARLIHLPATIHKNGDYPYLRHVSQDGKWLVMAAVQQYWNPDVPDYFVVPTGGAKDSGEALSLARKAVEPDTWSYPLGFLKDAKSLVAYDRKGIGVTDLETGRERRITLPETQVASENLTTCELSPGSRYALADITGQHPMYAIVDVQTGARTWTLRHEMSGPRLELKWLTDDTLLWRQGDDLRIVGRDGVELRKLDITE